jgi:DNA-binding NtrC family response regulator
MPMMKNIRTVLARTVRREISVAGDGEKAIELLEKEISTCCCRFEHAGLGIEVLKRRSPMNSSEVVVLTANATIQTAVEAMRRAMIYHETIQAGGAFPGH